MRHDSSELLSVVVAASHHFGCCNFAMYFPILLRSRCRLSDSVRLPTARPTMCLEVSEWSQVC